MQERRPIRNDPRLDAVVVNALHEVMAIIVQLIVGEPKVMTMIRTRRDVGVVR